MMRPMLPTITNPACAIVRRGAAPAAWQVFIAGFAGAAIMTVALLGLWFAGLVPSRDAGSAIADPASVAALNQRLAKIESSIAKLPASDQGTSERLSAADNAMKSLGIALTAINKRSDEVAANAAEARARADASEKVLTTCATACRISRRIPRPACLPPMSIPCKNASPRLSKSSKTRRPTAARGWR